MIICECEGITASTIRALARDGATKVSEVTRGCGAGKTCRSCRPAIARILRQTATETQEKDPQPTVVGAAAIARS